MYIIIVQYIKEHLQKQDSNDDHKATIDDINKDIDLTEGTKAVPVRWATGIFHVERIVDVRDVLQHTFVNKIDNTRHAIMI